MGDGPFREPQEPGGNPKGRGGYQGGSPLLDELGKKPKGDPYFTPPTDGTPGRARPHLDPPAFKPGGETQPPVTVQPERPAQPAPERWTPPKNTPGWDAKQPYSDQNNGSSPLSEAVGSNSKRLLESRDVQRGSSLSHALIAGTSGGLLTEPMVKGLGIAADKGAAVQGESLFARGARSSAALWKNNFDPVGIHSANIAKDEVMVGKSFESITKTHQLDQSLLKKLSEKAPLLADESAHMATLKQGLKITDDAKLIETLMERQAHMNPNAIKALNAAETGEHLSKIRSLELSRGGQIFTQAERGFLETRQLALSNIGKADVAAQTAKVETKWFTGSGAWDNAKRAFGYTLGTGLAIGVDHSVRDRMYGKDAKSWESTSVTVPLAVSMGAGFKGKAVWTAGALVAGHVADQLPFTPNMPESFKHFTAWDAVPLGIAFAMNPKGKIAKTALVGTAALLGNGMESAFTGPSPGDIEQRAVGKSTEDKQERTYSSFEKSVESFKELGNRNEILLQQNLADVLAKSNRDYKTMTQEEKLGAHRTTAALARALGEYRLEHGTRLAVGSTSTPTYILEGLNLDMGGEALTYLMMSRNSVNGSKAMTEILMDKQAYGTVVDKGEIADLNKVGDKVQAAINTINGKHDMEKAMTQLSAFLERGSTSGGATLNKEMAFHKTFVEDLNVKLGRNMPALLNRDGELNPDAAMIVSKLLRDQALAKLAHTAYKLNHGNDPNGAGQMLYGTSAGRAEYLPGTNKAKGFDGAMQCLMMAEKLSPNNPDLAELKAIATRLHEEVQAKAPSQYSNYKTNPLGVRPIGGH